MRPPVVSLSHVGAGCNRVTDALHWGEEGLLAFGAHNTVMVYHPEEARILGTLLGHTDRVNCVCWLPPTALGPAAAPASQQQRGCAALASGSSDGSVRIWQWSPGTPGQPWRLAATLQGHAGPVTSLATLPLPGGGPGLLLVSTAGDGDAIVWECSPAIPDNGSGGGGGGEAVQDADAASSADGSSSTPLLLQQRCWRLRQRIPLGHHLQACAALAPLPADRGWVLLALGGVDAAVRLFLCPPGPQGRFEPVCSLAGHQDWIKGLAFAQLDDGKLLLASASQDKNVRVWAVQQQQPAGQEQPPGSTSAATAGLVPNGGVLPAAAPADPAAAAAALLTRYAPKPLIRTDQHEYSATLEALLIGHEDWVHSVAWHPRVRCGSGGSSGGSGSDAGALSQPACLLSASMDRTMMIWRPDSATGLWMCEESVGDAGANHLGYYTGVWAPDGSGIAAHGFTGALHIWRQPGAAGDGEVEGLGGGDFSGDGWMPAHALGGHYGPVVDACWAADGACLLTVSADQTARITTQLAGGHWCEIARPQVHGHDFSSVAALPPAPLPRQQRAEAAQQPQQQGRYLYASGSEEKVIRVFEAPRAFRDTLAMARGRVVPASSGGSSGQQQQSGAAALGALLPALGLSNKAFFEEEDGRGGATQGDGGMLPSRGEAYGSEGPDLAPNPAPSAVAGPPLEEHLAQNTLWPEVHKLYGHGNELYCLAADPLGRFLASACRAQSADTAAIWLWDTARWTGAAQLHAHTLTVTQLAFSPDGRFLASASRDRTVAVFERQEQQQQWQGGRVSAAAAHAADGDAAPPFRLVGRIKAHSRIVWALHWSPDSRMLATGSRDGKVKVWSMKASVEGASALPTAPAAAIDCGDSVRSVQFVPDCQPGTSYHLAAGLEDGRVQLLRLAGEQQQPQLLQFEPMWQAPLHEQHAAAVRRLCWRREGVGAEGMGDAGPAAAVAAGGQRFQLASCSDDHSLRVFSVIL